MRRAVVQGAWLLVSGTCLDWEIVGVAAAISAATPQLWNQFGLRANVRLLWFVELCILALRIIRATFFRC